MDKPPIQQTRWFDLPRRELAVLAVGLALALLAVGVRQGFDLVWGARDVRISAHQDSLQPLRLDVNSARHYELITLPGVGPVTADAIIRHRKEHGPFRTLSDLTRVNGIGPKTVENIRPHAMCQRAEEADN